MRTRLSALLLTAAVTAGAGAFADARPRQGQIDGAVSADAAQTAAPASTALRLRGTVDSYDASTRTLSLATSNGTLRFPLASTARIRQDSQRIDAAELEKLAGYRAAVRYSQFRGKKTVESVHVFSRSKG